MKIGFVILFLSLSFIGKAQSFCDTMFGEKLITSDLFYFDSDTIFNNDTIDFYKEKELNTFCYIQLKKIDSTFQIFQGVHQYELFDKDSILPAATAFYYSGNIQGDGKWKYDSNCQSISFKQNNSEVWKKFEIEITNGKNDYRYLLRLIRIK